MDWHSYDNIGEVLSDQAFEWGGTPRMNEQLGYSFGPAGNLKYKTNNALLQHFTVNSLNELTNDVSGGTLTVMGSTTSPATGVTVNGTSALYADSTFAATNLPLLTTYTALANDSYGRNATNVATVSLSTNVAFQYDGNGNLCNDGFRNFAYDDENQLIQVLVSNAWMFQFSYDAKMRRNIRKEFTWQGSTWAQTNEYHYVYDGNLVVQERDANNLPTITYTRGKDLSGGLADAGGIGGLLARTAQPYVGSPLAGHSFYHCDANGNITMLQDSSQVVVAKYLYDAFGNTLSKSGILADANTYRFSTKELHQNSQLLYYLYRFYDANLQRWPNRDPNDELGFSLLGEAETSLDEEGNLYRYVDNDPISRFDPNGLCDYWQCLGCCIEKHRFNWGAVFGSLGSTLGFGTVPKTPAELAKSLVFGVKNPYTSQLSRWAGRLGGRPAGYGWIRDLGRSAGGRFLGGAATGSLIFEGFYDWGVIIRCSAVCARNNCSYQ